MKLTLKNTASVKLRSEASKTSTVLQTVLSSHLIDGIKELIDSNGDQWWQVEVRSDINDEHLQQGYILANFLKEQIDDGSLIEIDRKGLIRSLSFAAIIYGSNRDYLAVVAQIESGMQNIRDASGSEAIGPFQFTPAIWAELLVSMQDADLTNEDIVMPSTQALVAAYHSGRNIANFLKKRGVLPTGLELYLSDAFGMEIANVILDARDADTKKKLSELSLPAIKHYLQAKQATAIINKNNNATVEDLLSNIETQIHQATETIWAELNDNGISQVIDSGAPPWLSIARQELGVKEIPGRGTGQSNKRIEEYHDAAGSREPDHIPWCASFVSFCMANSNNPMIIENNLKSKHASDWLHWGEPINNPPVGALCVLSPLVKNSSGHVGFFIKQDSKTVTLLGGNQGGDEVCEKDFPVNKIRGFRWLNWTPSLPASTNKDENVDVLARTLWGEARGEKTKKGREAVASVVINRTKVPKRYGGTVKEVCKQRKQFSCWNSGDPNLPKLLKVTESDPIFAECIAIAKTAVDGNLIDSTIGARHYHADSITPTWAERKSPCVTIGHHYFYNNIS